MPYIKVINYPEAEGELKDIYDNLIEARGKLAEVHKIQSINPESIIRHMDLYMAIMFGKSPLKRAQREMIAVVVSAANECQYCMSHHGASLNQYWKNNERVEQLQKDFALAGLSDNDRLMCEYAWQLSKHPGSANHKQQVEKMKKAGISDRKILDAALVTAYFNFVNRLVLGLGVELEEDRGEGYKY